MKNFHPQSNHVSYLQQTRSSGNAGTVVVNPNNNEKIDTRLFGSNRAAKRACNNKLFVHGEDNISDKIKRLSLFPTAGLDNVDEDDELDMWDGMLIGRDNKNGVASAVTPLIDQCTHLSNAQAWQIMLIWYSHHC